MRIKINFTKNDIPVPISNQHILNGYIHKSLGIDNEYHDAKNDYSISHLCGGRLNDDKKTIDFNDGGYITITSLNTEFLGKILMGIMLNPNLGFGMNFKNVDHINEEFRTGWNHFNTLSPFLVKKYSDKKKYTFLTLNDVNFKGEIKNYLIKKISAISNKFDLTDFDVEIKNHPAHKIKKIMVKNVINHANQCHISIFCKKNVAELIYNIGLGQSTGSGFGSLYKTENHIIYK